MFLVWLLLINANYAIPLPSVYHVPLDIPSILAIPAVYYAVQLKVVFNAQILHHVQYAKMDFIYQMCQVMEYAMPV